MTTSTIEHLENVLSLPREPTRRGDVSDVERAGTNIIALLQQAADVAKRNEERTRSQAQTYQQQLQAAEAKLGAMQLELEQMEKRANEAEQWIERIFHSVRETLIEPLMARGENGSAKRRP
jgi:predicted  nucleic acid-binding Zn-ribbon protein